MDADTKLRELRERMLKCQMESVCNPIIYACYRHFIKEIDRMLEGGNVATPKRSASCGCRWNANIHGEVCPEHGVAAREKE